jgi:hypothetical protein
MVLLQVSHQRVQRQETKQSTRKETIMLDTATCTLKYDLEMSQWIAMYDRNTNTFSYGDTPDEAIALLKAQLNKHDLW